MQTDTELAAADVTLKYKDLLLVECVFRNMIRSAAKGDVTKALQAAGVALGRAVRCEGAPSASPPESTP